MAFEQQVIEAARRDREIELTTFGRKSGRPTRKTLWVGTDGRHIYVRSGQGLSRDWPQNVLASGRAVLHIAGRDLPVSVTHVLDPGQARQVTELYHEKYGSTPQRPPDGGPTPAEQATFELRPAES